MAVQAGVAQWIERFPPEKEVGGSNPLVRTLYGRYFPTASYQYYLHIRRNPVIGKKMHEALQKQLNMELYSYYLYMAMSAHFNDINLKGFANWLRIQAQEEMIHSMKFFDQLLDRRAKVTLFAIDAPPSTWKSPLAAFEDAFAHEEKVTASINELSSLAIAEKDHASSIFLEWFVTEQVEELSSADAIIQDLKLIGDDKGALFFIDRELAKRVLTLAANTTAAP